MKKILVVDDEAFVIRVLRLFLDKNGFQVISANNGMQALEKVNAEKPDVIITDIDMPNMTGQQLCEKVLEDNIHPLPYMVVMTSRSDRELRDWIENHEQLMFFEKPLSPRKLCSHLHTYFENSLQAVSASA